MSTRILYEFYHGNLSPADRQIIKGSEIFRTMDELSKAEAALEQSLPPELLLVLKRLADAQLTVNSLTAESCYVDGFRTGAKFMLAIHDDGADKNLNVSMWQTNLIKGILRVYAQKTDAVHFKSRSEQLFRF